MLVCQNVGIKEEGKPEVPQKNSDQGQKQQQTQLKDDTRLESNWDDIGGRCLLCP